MSEIYDAYAIQKIVEVMVIVITTLLSPLVYMKTSQVIIANNGTRIPQDQAI